MIDNTHLRTALNKRYGGYDIVEIMGNGDILMQQGRTMIKVKAKDVQKEMSDVAYSQDELVAKTPSLESQIGSYAYNEIKGRPTPTQQSPQQQQDNQDDILPSERREVTQFPQKRARPNPNQYDARGENFGKKSGWGRG